MLRSSNIATIYDLGEHGDRPFIVMELVAGEALSARLTRGPLPIPEAVSIAAQAADALDEAHGHGIIHRDVKSANLMVDGRGRVKLLDFGLAKYDERPTASSITTGALLETQPGTVMGTFTYMSPEQVRGRAARPALGPVLAGVVLYEMLTGRLPFEGETATDVADRILNGDPPALSRFNYAVPERLDAIVLKALAKDPAFRYQSARELYIDLHAVGRWLDDPNASRSRRMAPGSAPAASARRPPSARPEAPPAIAVMTFGNTTREPADDWIGSGIAETVTADLRDARGVTIIGRTQVHDAIKHLSGPSLERVAEQQAIEIGRRLGASYIIGGAYQRLGGLIRITAELVDVRAASLVRTVKVDGKVDDLFALQDRVVAAMQDGLSVAIPNTPPVGHKETTSLAAWEAFSRGQLNLRTATRDSLVARPDAVRAGRRARSALCLRVGAHRPDLQPAGAVPVAAGAAGEGDGGARARPRAGPGERLRADRPGRRAAGRGPQRRGDRRGDAGGGPRSGQPGRPQHAGPGLLDGQGADRRGHRRPGAAPGPTTRMPATCSSSWRCSGRSRAIWPPRKSKASAPWPSRKASNRARKGCSWSAATSGWATCATGRAATTARWPPSPAEQAFLAEHDHALKGRLQIEILQKQGAAHWRKGDREAADRAFAEMMKAFRARQSRGADDPFTKYYVASLCALRGESGRRAALSGRLRGCPAGADAGPRPARSGLRRPAGGPRLSRPGRRRCRRRASAGGRCPLARKSRVPPRFTASWRRRFTRSPF